MLCRLFDLQEFFKEFDQWWSRGRHLHAKESAEEVDVDNYLDQLGVNQGNAHLVPIWNIFVWAPNKMQFAQTR